MSQTITLTRATDLRAFQDFSRAGKIPFSPQQLIHVYIKLDFKHEFENARTAENARGFLRSVTRAAMAAEHVASLYDGVLLEVQGSTLHVGIPSIAGSADAYVAVLHRVYQAIFDGNGMRVNGWRMTADSGNTLVVSGRGVHGDESYVSLGKAANRPAKHLYSQLEIPEDRRNLKRFYVGVYFEHSDEWKHTSLDHLPVDGTTVNMLVKQARQYDPRLEYIKAVGKRAPVTARALPIDPAGTPSAPSPDRPHTYFGWVMRADLDGFTKRVEDCFDNDFKLQELATEFYTIMDAAAQFVSVHNETLAQLPWAGDNFTAASVFNSKDEYDKAISKRIVELSLDFEKEMHEAAGEGGFGGWAYGVAGGQVHGNSNGNIYIAGIEVDDRRFLVGAGEGFGRSTQAFGDIDPASGEMVVYKDDYACMDEIYKGKFTVANTKRGEASSLFYISKCGDLNRARAWTASVAATTVVTMPKSRTQSVTSRPYCR